MNSRGSVEPRNDGLRLTGSIRAPGHRTRILVADRDPSALAVVRSILRSQDWEVITAKTGAEALDKARQEGPDAVISEYTLPDMSGADLSGALRQRSETAAIPILILSASAGVSERVASLRAGASDYLVKPPDAQELIARLRAALDLRQEKAAFVIVVLGSKGGVGASSISVNVAIALRHETRSGVVLVDASQSTSAADIMLNLQSTATYAHLLGRIDELEQSDFEAILTPHSSGLQVLVQEQGAAAVPPEHLRKVILALRRMRDFVVVDTGLALDRGTEGLLDLADRVLVVLTPEITALRGARHFLERARHLGLSRERIVLILNRYPQRGGLQRRDIETALGLAMQMTIPDDGKLLTYTINRGVPVMMSHRRSDVARQMSGMARVLIQAAREQ
ncbi:MAG: response regulator [Anaerolineae bacterium]|nr:response regulator [Anaerolineae bacterium]